VTPVAIANGLRFAPRVLQALRENCSREQAIYDDRVRTG
jgi:hypothetical protein